MTEKRRSGLSLASPETRRRVSILGGKASKGKPKSEATKQKMREAYLRNQAKKANG